MRRRKNYFFGLDDNGKLHLKGKIICNSCNSFSVYSNFGGKRMRQDLLFIGALLSDFFSWN